MLDNNLGPKDPDLIKFIGRDKYLSALWAWLLERFSPIKLLAGLGGVGKTTIARNFSETVATESPLGFERVIWLSAKGKYWRSFKGKPDDVDPSEVKYFDTRSFLIALLLELGALETEIDEDMDITDLIQMCFESLKLFPSLVVIDDVDSLSENEQYTLFQTVVQLFGMTISSSLVSSKALLTARLDLGAAPTQLLKVSGLEFEEFKEYVQVVVAEYEIDSKFLGNKSLIERFHRATDGSPIFVNSILRLVAYGEKLETAIEQWKGSDGEEVRKFTFEREISFLSDSELRTLLALSELKLTSMVELQHVLEINRTRLRDNLARLRKYHLIVREDEAPAGGPDLAIPNSIKLMQSILETHVRNTQPLKNRCKDARAGSATAKLEIGIIVNKVVNLWRTGEASEALELAEWASKNHPNQPDLCCLLGRAYLRIDCDSDCAKKADAAFRKAHLNNCKRPELYQHWLEAKQTLGDWQGIVDVTRFVDQRQPSHGNLMLRVFAMKKLGEEAKNRADLRRAAECFLLGAEEIQSFLDRRLTKGHIPELFDIKADLVKDYVATSDSLFRNPNEYLYTWHACCKAFDLHVRIQSIIYLGLRRLKDWWSTVENRHQYDEKAPKTLKVQLIKLNKLADGLFRQQRQLDPIYNEILETRDYLQGRMEEYDASEKKGDFV
jgi:hypothetical protein